MTDKNADAGAQPSIAVAPDGNRVGGSPAVNGEVEALADTPPEQADWDLFFVLPNLNPPVPSPFETKLLCICSGNDPLLERVTDTAANNAGREMLKRYKTWFGRAYMPACLLVRGDAERLRTSDALRAFRNVCAVSSVTHAVALRLNGGQWEPTYTNFFLFAPHVAGKNGWITKLDGIVKGMDEVDEFQGQCDGQIDLPEGFQATVDKVLFKRLMKAWESVYVIRPRDDGLLPLFRSLEVAFHAALFPSDGLTSISDAGTRIGLWVSAFEVLCHPGGGGRVNKRVVHNFLSTATLTKASLKRRRYTVQHGGQYKVSLLGLIYEDLYNARNSFMHGNPVARRDLKFRRAPSRPSLFALAALAYNVALRRYMKSMFPVDEDDKLEDEWFAFEDVQKALLTAFRGGSGE